MLTSYLVRCAAGCGWSGSLLPSRNTESWRGASPAIDIALFQCPECQAEWQARIVGDDVVASPLEEVVSTA